MSLASRRLARASLALATAAGLGVKAYGGADVSAARGQARKISSADISICYAPNSSTPATQCYNFTVNRGD